MRVLRVITLASYFDVESEETISKLKKHKHKHTYISTPKMLVDNNFSLI